MTGSLSFPFPQYSEAGIWTVSEIRVYDAVGNIRTLLTAEIAAAGFPTQLTVNTVFPSDTTAPNLQPSASRPRQLTRRQDP